MEELFAMEDDTVKTEVMRSRLPSVDAEASDVSVAPDGPISRAQESRIDGCSPWRTVNPPSFANVIK